MNVAADRRGAQTSGNPGHLDLAAHRPYVVEVVAHRARRLYFETDARLAVAVPGIAHPDVDIAGAAAIFDLDHLLIAAALGRLDDDRVSVVAGNNHITRDIVDSHLPSCADAIALLKILSGGGCRESERKQRRSNKKSKQSWFHLAALLSNFTAWYARGCQNG